MMQSVVLARRPVGNPVEADFALLEAPLPLVGSEALPSERAGARRLQSALVSAFEREPIGYKPDDGLGDVVLRMMAGELRVEGGTLMVDGIDVRESRAHCDSFPD